MRVLLVDDEYAKVEALTRALHAVSNGCSIEHATTAVSAREALHRDRFDVLLIDLHLPDAVGSPPTEEGGIRFLDLVFLDQAVTLPAEIIFVTAKEDSSEAVKKRITSSGVPVCGVDLSAAGWTDFIGTRVGLVQRRLMRQGATQERIDVAIVTALREPELSAVQALPYDWQAKRYPNDPTTYHFGTIKGHSRSISIVAACAQRKGMPSASALAMRLAEKFSPRYLVMLGICAGIPKKVNFGDVVVANPTWDWGSGKLAQAIKGSPVFMAAPHQMPLNSEVSGLLNELAVNKDVLAAIRAGWTNETPKGKLSVKVGPMASGASVIADREARKLITAQHRELLAIEMEAYGVMAAAEYCSKNKPISVAIKSVCDFADPKKNDDWQLYAAYTSAAFADHWFRCEGFTV